MQKSFLVVFSLGLLFFAGNAQADPISDFVECTNSGKSETECYRSEAQRYVRQIQEKYNKYAEDSYYDGFKVDKTQTNSEKFRKLMNMWKMYAQNYCNLFNYTRAKEEDTTIDPNECLYQQAIKQLNEIEAIESTRESDPF